jgi:hypothetical protein
MVLLYQQAARGDTQRSFLTGLLLTSLATRCACLKHTGGLQTSLSPSSRLSSYNQSHSGCLDICCHFNASSTDIILKVNCGAIDNPACLTNLHQVTMCLYWKKMHTCGHQSDRPYIEMCKPGILTNTVCSDIGEDDNPRHSHFPCYPCIRGEARAEAETQARLVQEAAAKAHQAREVAVRERQAAELRAKEERIRREAREKAARERAEEARIKVLKEKEEERAKQEGGRWIETASIKKGRGKKGGGAGGALVLSPAHSIMKPTNSREKKENEGNVKLSPEKEGKSMDLGGRAGTWGPKKILSRKENMDLKN